MKSFINPDNLQIKEEPLTAIRWLLRVLFYFDNRFNRIDNAVFKYSSIQSDKR